MYYILIKATATVEIRKRAQISISWQCYQFVFLGYSSEKQRTVEKSILLLCVGQVCKLYGLTLDREHLQKLSRPVLLKVRFTAINISTSQEFVTHVKFLDPPRPTESETLEVWAEIRVLILKFWRPLNFENYCVFPDLPSCFCWEGPCEFHMIFQGDQF